MQATLMGLEIAAQAEAIESTLQGLASSREEIKRIFDGVTSVLFMARGTSDNVADYGQYLLATTAGVLASSGSPSLATAFNAELNLTNHLVIAISQSGSTAEILQSLIWAKKSGAKTLALTNVADSPITKNADLTLFTLAGQERAVPATKSFSSAMSAMAWIASSLTGGSFDSELADLPTQVGRVLAAKIEWLEVEGAIGSAETLLVSGRGFGQSVAREIALKLQECALINAAGLSFADLRHGPAAVLKAGVPLISLGVSSASPFRPGLIDLQSAARQAGAPIINIGPVAAADSQLVQISLPEVSDYLLPILQVIPGQKIAERIALNRGLNPDQPPGLNKVTQTI